MQVLSMNDIELVSGGAGRGTAIWNGAKWVFNQIGGAVVVGAATEVWDEFSPGFFGGSSSSGSTITYTDTGYSCAP